MNTWDLNKRLDVGENVQPILASGTHCRRKSHLPSDDSSQTPTAKHIIIEVTQLGELENWKQSKISFCLFFGSTQKDKLIVQDKQSRM